jgi:outer membrane protein OmpA-like peptidoglycan-associated protein
MGNDITRRDHDKTYQRPTTDTHVFHLQPFQGWRLEMGDVHFHHDSAVLLPDYDVVPDASRITALAVLAACLNHAKKNPAMKLLIAGHTDTTGRNDYNLGLSELRAKSVFFALTGDKDGWVGVAESKHKVEDYQLILKWASQEMGYDSDPGAINNSPGPKTTKATKRFQEQYNEDYGTSIPANGVVGAETWGAFFELYMEVLAELLKTDKTGLAAIQGSLKWVQDGVKLVGCGEEFPIDAPQKNSYESKTNRRVEMLFFEPGQEPKLDCHPGPGKTVPVLCEIYNPWMYRYKKISPTPIPKLANVVTPKLEAEYLVALLRRTGDPWDKYPADPTYIEIRYEESRKRPHYPEAKKLTLKSGGHLMLATENDFSKAVEGDLPVTAKQVGGVGKKFKVWVWGKTAGAFKLQLALEDSGLANVATDPPAEIDFGVVQLELVVHQHDAAALAAVEVDPGTDPIATYHTNLKAKALPAQKELTDAEKTAEATARLLHAQKDGNFGRARLLCRKLVAAQWPAGTDDYSVVMSAAADSGSVKVFDAEFEGSEVAAPSVKVSALKAADKEFWAEGATVTTKQGDARLHLGLDRAAGGLAKTAKNNADWARFTVVEIKEVKFEVTTDADKAVTWNAAKKRFYVNADANGRNLKDDAAGRKITVTATLAQEFPDVVLHFMLVGDKKIYTQAHWGANIAAGFDWGKLDKDLKAKDKTDRKKIIHVSAKTDAKGVAKTADLVLSNFGGEVYKIGAYTSQDPHLAKYVDGHADLGKHKPALSEEIPIWRKIFIQISHNNAVAIPARALTETAFGDNKVFVEIEEIDLKKFTKADIPGLVEHPDWQFHPGGAVTNVICVGAHNKAGFYGLLKAATVATSPKAHLIMCDVQWDPILGTVQNFSLTASSGSVNYKNAAGNKYLGVFNPPLSGVMVPANSSFWNWNDGAVVHLGWLTSASVAVQQTRGHTSEVKVTLPARCVAGVCSGCAGGTNITPTNAKPATFSLQLNAATGPWAGESGQPGSPQCLIVVDTNLNRFNNTIAHEIGHLFYQVRAATNWHGVPDHPDQYVKRGGQGSHCKRDATEDATKVDQDGKKIYVGGTCVMYHVAVGNVIFCDNCKTDMRVRAMSDFFL